LNDPEPLLALTGACIESGGVTTDPVTASGGERLVALVGYWSPLFRLLRAEASLTAGELRFAGIPYREALASGTLALASRDAPSSAWTTERYLTESARFSGLTRRAARERVAATSASFGVLAYAKRRLRDLPTAARRVLPLVRACLGHPRVVCAEAPLSDLDATDAVIVAAALERVVSDHAVVLSFPARPADGPSRVLLERADFAFELGRDP
jgi:hypothetical protein